MGQDYSYTQPSSSEKYGPDYLCLLEAQALCDEAESSYNVEAESIYNVVDPVQYTPQQECDGISNLCPELSDFGSQLRELKEQINATEQKLIYVEKIVYEQKRFSVGVCLMVGLLLIAYAVKSWIGRHV